MGISLAKQLMSLQEVFVISKVYYFGFLVPSLYTFNPLSLLLKWGMILVATTYRNMEKEKFCKTTNKIRVNGSERRPFILIFRLIIVLCDSDQTDEIVMEIEELKQKVPDDYLKSFGRVLLGVYTSIVS